MSAAWKSAGLTYVPPTALVHPMRADRPENWELMLYTATTAT